MPQVSDVMTRGVRAMSASDTLQFAAQAMDELNVGVIPVCDGERLIGMVSDRDITVRGVAQGRAAEGTPISEVMSASVRYCFEDQSIDEAADQMRQAQVRRLPVLDRAQRLVGMLSLGDIATKIGADQAADVLNTISEPAEPDRSGNSAASGSAGGGSASGEPSRMP